MLVWYFTLSRCFLDSLPDLKRSGWIRYLLVGRAPGRYSDWNLENLHRAFQQPHDKLGEYFRGRLL